MAMYFMNGKTFLNQYIKEDPRKVMKTQFVIVSSTIRKRGKYEKQVINANNILYPRQELIMDYDDYKNNHHYFNEYKSQLDENRAFLATLIKYVIEEGYTIVFLCGHKEKKYYYLNILQEYMLDVFEFHMYDYKKFKDGKDVQKEFYTNNTINICNKVLKKAKKKQKKKMLQTEDGRLKVFSSMSKKELKKELIKRDLYIKSMSKSEMIDTLDAFV